MKEDLLLLKIHNAVNEGKDYYEATRGNWKVSKMRFDSIQYVVGVNRGKIVCVFQPTKWGIIDEGTDKGRAFFDGVNASNNVLIELQNAEDQLLKKFGSGNPVAYATYAEIQ